MSNYTSSSHSSHKSNRLIHESSPYLLQHSGNPVDWYAWGDEALSKAKNENKPLLISIGYAACHWCHVMEHESFENEEVAAFMNNHFICVKVDREERPDVDKIYMDAVQLITGSGGWPLNAFALPDGRPFYGGTYFPLHSWLQIMGQVVMLLNERMDDVLKQADALANHISAIDYQMISNIDNSTSFDFSDVYRHDLFPAWKLMIDQVNGGFSGAPKFVLPVGWEFLLQYGRLTKNADVIRMVDHTLSKIAAGGINDHIGGGFARYSVDDHWHVPHFEKMLYDNGQLVSLYSHAFQMTGNSAFQDVADQIICFAERELLSPVGGFYASINADSEGEEGRFYVFTEDEIISNTPAASYLLFCDRYGITSNGNWEDGKNVLVINKTFQQLSAAHQLTPETCAERVSEATSQLFEFRASRIRPSTDIKILTSWNALMLKGLVDVFRSSGNERYLDLALKNASFLTDKMIDNDGHVLRNYANNRAFIDGFLDDYAFLANAFIELYQVTFNPVWLNKAYEISCYVLAHFGDDQSVLFFYTSDLSDQLIVRKIEVMDNVTPSSNAVMAHNLLVLGTMYGLPEWIDRSNKMVAQVVEKCPAGGPYYARWNQVMGLLVTGMREVVIMGGQAVQMSRELQRNYHADTLFLGSIDEVWLPAMNNRLVKDKTLIYICKNNTCQLPVDHIEEALTLLKG